MADILVVEDHPMTLKLTRLTLEAEGHTVRTAQSGRSALAQAKLCLPDLILLDLMLPDGSGGDLLVKLRGLPQADKLPVLAFSMYLGDAERARALDCGFTDLVPKPISPALLVAKVNSLVSS